MRRILVALTVVVLAVLTVAGVAIAQEDEATPDVNRPARGLAASGDGTASLDVERGALRLWVVGDVVIEGPSELDVRIESFADGAAPQTEGGTRIELTDFAGSVFVKGTDFTVQVDGHMAFHAHGQGTANLDGSGLWKTRLDKGVWPASFGYSE